MSVYLDQSGVPGAIGAQWGGVTEGFLDALAGEITNSGLPLNANPLKATNQVNVKSGRGSLFGFSVYSNLGAGQFIQLFNATSLPADGAVPWMSWAIATVANLDISWVIPGRSFDQGLWLCNSTTALTKTIGAANCLFDVQYI